MADIKTKESRSYNMSRIAGKNTKPEELVRKYLFSKGFRYRKNVRKLPGTPDVVLPKYRTVIFVNGCFWHGHEGCKMFRMPQKNGDFWEKKINRNRERDRKNKKTLEDNGWQVIVIWECELTTNKLEQTMRKVELQLQQYSLQVFCAKPYSIPQEEDYLYAAEDWREYEL